MCQTAFKIQKSKSTMSFSQFPFVTMFVNCCIWIMYALLQSDLTVLVPNCTGLFASIYCLFTYESYSKVDFPIPTYAVSVIIITIGLLFAFAQSSTPIGLMGDVLAVMMMGSPLSVMGTVIKSRSTVSMPFATSLSAWGNGLSWSLYGFFIVHDPLVCKILDTLHNYSSLI